MNTGYIFFDHGPQDLVKKVISLALESEISVSTLSSLNKKIKQFVEDHLKKKILQFDSSLQLMTSIEDLSKNLNGKMKESIKSILKSEDPQSLEKAILKLKLYVRAGADLNNCNEYGTTFFNIICEKAADPKLDSKLYPAYQTLINFCLRYGADPNKFSLPAPTLLLFCTFNTVSIEQQDFFEEIVEKLLQYGANSYQDYPENIYGTDSAFKVVERDKKEGLLIKIKQTSLNSVSKNEYCSNVFLRLTITLRILNQKLVVLNK